MTVQIKFIDTEGKEIGIAVAEDHKSISQIAEKNGIDIPIACCHWACMVCNCKIKSGAEYVQIDKITTPAILPKKNQNNEWIDVLTCVGGISSEAIKDKEVHEVVLEKVF